MELTRAQRTAIFVVIAAILAGLGWYLFLPAASSAGGQARHSSRTAPGAGSASGGLAAPQQAGDASPSPPASAAGGQGLGAAPAASRRPDIYQWLPFTRSDLAAAASVVIRFSDDYGTFSYTQDASGYLAPMRGLISGQLAQVLAGAYSSPGVASLRRARKQVSAGTAAISSLRAFGPSSLTFVAAITQRIAESGGSSRLTVDYAVTVTRFAGAWQVSDIELATAGNS